MRLLLYILAVICTMSVTQAQEKIEWRKDKVTQIIFPAEVAKFRTGYASDSALSQCDGRVLYIQPFAEMNETNINVITTDGNYYAFNLIYNDQAVKVNYIIEQAASILSDIDATPDAVVPNTKQGLDTQGQIATDDSKGQDIFAQVEKQHNYIAANNVTKQQKLAVLLQGVYADEKHVYLKFSVENASNIPFDVDYIAFSITAKTTKKTATQERMQITPIGVKNEIHRVPAQTACEVIYAFEKFTIGKDKILLVEVLEQGGDRNIGLKVSENFIINARKL